MLCHVWRWVIKLVCFILFSVLTLLSVSHVVVMEDFLSLLGKINVPAHLRKTSALLQTTDIKIH